MRVHTDILTKSVYSTKDNTYQNLKRIINDKTLAVVPGDKDSCVIIMRIANFKDHPKYQKMLPTSNQPARLYGTAKAHKFASPHIITTEKFGQLLDKLALTHTMQLK